MIPMQLMIGQLTGQPNPFAPQAKRVYIADDSPSKAEERIGVVMAFIKTWPDALHTEGFTTSQLSRRGPCGEKIACAAVKRLLESGYLVDLGIKRQGAPLYRRADHGQIQSAA